ncbi:MAG: bifunctional 3,4-dihydroxy-2-butanone-4-phosphate synthase/GTP cyclohydrolase II [Gemmatimonadales bacterium]|nr:bifunctional 3,4-dihydroxy-2-butanone-4-phosphate synthase/GTP cyclohydrolase II [Gemmatimonadales bacterium]
MTTFGTIDQAIEDLRNGKIVIVADDEDRENEGDLVCAAELVTPETINFMTLHGRGLICLALTGERCDQLGLPQMTDRNSEELATAFTVSIDAERRFGVTTGISARDRASTIHVAINPATVPGDLRRPGHIFPLRARPGGVLQRVGQTEASVDLARLAGLIPAGVICEILNPDGSMARRPELHEMSLQHGLTFVTVAQLVAYRLRAEQLVHRVAEARVPTEYGEFRMIGYQNDVDRAEHVALVFGDIAGQPNVLVRMHSKCLTGDVFGSQRCDCGFQLRRAMELIARDGRGAIVYLDQEGRGIGLLNKLRAYALQDSGADTVQANERLGFAPDLRNYGIGAQILRDLGLSSIRVMTNNPRKLVGLEGYGLQIVERLPLLADPNQENRDYLQVKRDKLGHLLSH